MHLEKIGENEEIEAGALFAERYVPAPEINSLGLAPSCLFLWCKRLLWNIDWNNMATFRIKMIRVSTATQSG
jgi:hypothetical protein